MRVLAFETSCDETAVAVVSDGRHIHASVVRSQIDLHRLYGGVVPEIASRAHVESITQLTREALKQASCSLCDIDAVAVTAWPGLIGALIVGVNFAKSLAFSAGLPIIPVHHLRGHVASAYLTDPSLSPPFLCLIVSGGHTSLVWVEGLTTFKTLGSTRDDAAGECFDKVARMMGLPYPGGVALDQLSQGGDATAYTFPYPVVRGAPLDFSFSGLKTAAFNQINRIQQQGETLHASDFAASLSSSVADLLCGGVELAVRETGAKKIAIVGGVAANSVLRIRAQEVASRLDVQLVVPERALCGDNAAMIGAQAAFEYHAGVRGDSTLNAQATMGIEGTASQ